jgi:DNA-binding MarR family transcriptional regulator
MRLKIAAQGGAPINPEEVQTNQHLISSQWAAAKGASIAPIDALRPLHESVNCIDNSCSGNYSMRVKNLDANAVYDLKPNRTNEDFVPLVMRVRMAIIQALDQEFLRDKDVAPLEVTSAQFAILKHVLTGRAAAACELCKVMDYDRGAMSRMIDRLEKKGLVRRVALAHTRRTQSLEATPAGNAAFPKMQACLSRVVNRMLKGVTRTQMREVETVLRRMLTNQ